MELIDPKCSTCGGTPRPRSTTHLYIDLPAILPKLEAWINEASVKGFWANNAIQMTQAWIRDGLHPRAITRDLKWGIPVPKKGFENKVFYVWFDAPIGYISMTVKLAKEKGFDWKSWWQNPEEVELFQFIGKDNIPFHTVIFPSSLLGSGRHWTMLHHMSSTEYLNYEAGKFPNRRVSVSSATKRRKPVYLRMCGDSICFGTDRKPRTIPSLGQISKKKSTASSSATLAIS